MRVEQKIHKETGRWLVRESWRTEQFLFSVTGHFGEGLVKFVGDRLELLLLVDELIFEPVHLLLQLGDGPLCELGASLSLLQLRGQRLNLFLVRLLSLVGLLL